MILYVANIQTEELWTARNNLRNRSLAGSNKIRLITRALCESGESVCVLSSGKTGETRAAFWPELEQRISATSSIVYARFREGSKLRHIWSSIDVIWNAVKRLPRIEVALVYNITLETIFVAVTAAILRKYVIVEYEDAITEVRSGMAEGSWNAKRLFAPLERVMGLLSEAAIVPSASLASRLGQGRFIIVPSVGDYSYTVVAHPGRYFFYGGALEESKGVITLMRAFESLDVPILISGSGPLENIVRGWALARPDLRQFVGLVSRREYERLSAGAFACVNPHICARHAGGLWPYKIMEYMALCGAVVSTPIEGGHVGISDRLVLARSDGIEDVRQAVLHAAERGFSEETRALNRQWARALCDYRAVGGKLLNLIKCRKVADLALRVV